MPSHNITSQSQPQCVYRFKPDHQSASAANSQASGFARSPHLSSHQPRAHTIKFCKPVRSVRFVAQEFGVPRTQFPAINKDNTDIEAGYRIPTNSLRKNQIPACKAPESRAHNFISYGHLLASPLAPAPTIEFCEPVRSVRLHPQHPNGKTPAQTHPSTPHHAQNQSLNPGPSRRRLRPPCSWLRFAKYGEALGLRDGRRPRARGRACILRLAFGSRYNAIFPC